jgi:hypothetical protein
VVSDQDHGRVRTDSKEGRVADRDLTRVAGHDVQSQIATDSVTATAQRIALKFSTTSTT